MSFFGLFGGNKSANIEEYLNEGAVIIDVRSVEEYKRDGRVEKSKNIPLHTLPVRIDEVTKLNKKIICVCRSGARSGQAASFLKRQGVDAINGGPWQNVNSCLK